MALLDGQDDRQMFNLLIFERLVEWPGFANPMRGMRFGQILHRRPHWPTRGLLHRELKGEVSTESCQLPTSGDGDF